MARSPHLFAWALTLRALATSAELPSQHKICTQLSISVTVSANNSVYNIPRIDNTIDMVDLVWDIDTWTHENKTWEISERVVTGTFLIDAELCIPGSKEAGKSDILIIATHGIGFTKKYWDVEIRPEEYSFVDAITKAGYPILTYDRLGLGKSSKPDPYEVTQASLEIEILRGLTDIARAGKLLDAASESPQPKIDSFLPRKIVHVGHSFGSLLTLGMLSKHGALSDGAIITGFAPTVKLTELKQAGFGWEYAGGRGCGWLSDRGSGYVVQGTKGAIQHIHFKKGKFEPELLNYAEKTKETLTIGEFLPFGPAFGAAPEFTGPIQFFLGENDAITCDGDCNGVEWFTGWQYLFFAAKKIDVYLQPGTGHSLTLHTNATAGYEVIFSYLDSQGL